MTGQPYKKQRSFLYARPGIQKAMRTLSARPTRASDEESSTRSSAMAATPRYEASQAAATAQAAKVQAADLLVGGCRSLVSSCLLVGGCRSHERTRAVLYHRRTSFDGLSKRVSAFFADRQNVYRRFLRSRFCRAVWSGLMKVLYRL